MKFNVNQIRAFHAVQGKSGIRTPHDTFHYFLWNSFEVLLIVMKDKGDISKHRKANRKRNNSTQASNFIVNAVTGLEVYLKKIISMNSGWDEKGYESILDQKITLIEAYRMIKKENITLEYVVSQYVSFSNFDNINSTFSKLVGVGSFFDDLEQNPMSWADELNGVYETTLFALEPNWRDKLKRMYLLRNRFVHEGNVDDDSFNFALELFSTMIKLTVSMNIYFMKKYPEVYNRKTLGSAKLI